MKIAVFGSRDFRSPELVVARVAAFEDGTVVISGGARGVDRVAEGAAKARGLEVSSIPADWDGPLLKGAGFDRNSAVVAEGEECLAFLAPCRLARCATARCFGRGWTHGTVDAIRKAEERGKKVTIVLESGRVVERFREIAR